MKPDTIDAYLTRQPEPVRRVLEALRRTIQSTIGPRMLVAGNIVGWGGPFRSRSR